MGSLEVPSGPRLTTMSYCILGCPEYGMTNASNFKWGFTPDRNPKRGNKKMGNNIDIDLCKSANAKKNRVMAYLTVFSEYGMANASIPSVALPLTETPTLVIGGNKICIYLCKRTKFCLHITSNK